MKAPLITFNDHVYRAMPLQYSEKPLSGDGSLTSAGRYHTPGVGRVVYLTTTSEGMLREKSILIPEGDTGYRSQPFPPSAIVTVRAQISNVLVLTDQSILDACGTSYAELVAPWVPTFAEGHPSPTQILGDTALATRRIHALLAPSARGDTWKNLVVFRDNLTLGDILEVAEG